MKHKNVNQKIGMLFMAFLLLTPASFAFADYGAPITYRAVDIVRPANNSSVTNPVKVCMEPFAVWVEPAKNGVNENKGHHHLLIDVDLPSDLTKPIGKDANHIHMGDGSSCKELTLTSGKHNITTLFAQGNHIPFNPPLSATITVTVK